MMESLKDHPGVTYCFEGKLESIVASRGRDRNNSDSDVIDLTNGDENVL
jgi:hypothetical protein